MSKLEINSAYVFAGLIVILIVLMYTANPIFKHPQKCILVQTELGIFDVPLDACDAFLTQTRTNIIDLYKGMRRSDIQKIAEYAEHAADHLETFLGTKITEHMTDREISELFSSVNKTEEIDLLEIKVSRILYALDAAKKSIAYGNRKQLNMTYVHKMMEQMYAETGFYDKPVSSIVMLLDAGSNKKKMHVARRNGVMTPAIHDTFERETPLYSYDPKSQERSVVGACFDKRELVSQDFVCPPERDYILTSKNSQPFAPFCDINAMRAERERKLNLTTDRTFNRSLRNDYDYLDQ